MGKIWVFFNNFVKYLRYVQVKLNKFVSNVGDNLLSGARWVFEYFSYISLSVFNIFVYNFWDNFHL